MAIDLHIHTTASSDGDYTPEEVVRMARDFGLEAIAITDHDSVKSVAEGLNWGKKYGVEVIPGCEFYAEESGKWLHILGYFLDYHNEDLLSHCINIEKDRVKNIDRQIEVLKKAGFHIEKEKVLEDSDKPMYNSFGYAVFADPRNNNNPLLAQYDNPDNRVILFCKDWIVPGKPLNAPFFTPRSEDIIKIILRCGGVPILGHPGATLTPQDDDIIDNLRVYGLEGLEVYTSWHNEEQEAYYRRYCDKNRLIYTCGSDLHGKLKPHVKLGMIKNNTYEIVRLLKEKRKQIHMGL